MPPPLYSDIITISHANAAESDVEPELEMLAQIPKFRPIIKDQSQRNSMLGTLWATQRSVASEQLEAYRRQLQLVGQQVEQDQTGVLEQLVTLERKADAVVRTLDTQVQYLKEAHQRLQSLSDLRRQAKKSAQYVDEIGQYLGQLNQQLPSDERLDFSEYITLRHLAPIPRTPAVTRKSTIILHGNKPLVNPPPKTTPRTPVIAKRTSIISNRSRAGSLSLQPRTASPRESVRVSLSHAYAERTSEPLSATPPTEHPLDFAQVLGMSVSHSAQCSSREYRPVPRPFSSETMALPLRPTPRATGVKSSAQSLQNSSPMAQAPRTRHN